MTEEEYCAIRLLDILVSDHAILQASDWNYVASYLLSTGDTRVVPKAQGESVTSREWQAWQHAIYEHLHITIAVQEEWDKRGWPIDASQWNAVVTAVYQRRHAEVVI